MARKTNDMLLFAALIVVALALVLQGLAMKNVLANDFDGEEYTVPQYIDESLFKYPRTPYDKALFDEMYSKYNHVSEDGQTLTLFSSDQWLELEADRNNGVRQNLTLDHYLYILEDTVDMYFSYPKIIMIHYFAQWDMTYFVEIITNWDYPSEAKSDIYRIAAYRFEMLDPGIRAVSWGRLEGGLETYIEQPPRDMGIPFYSDTVTLLDGSTKIDDEYLEKLMVQMKNFRSLAYNQYELPMSCKWDEISAQSPMVVFDYREETFIVFDTVTKDAYAVFPDDMISQKVIDNRLN